MPRFLASPFRLPKRRQLTAQPDTQMVIEKKLLHRGEKVKVSIQCAQTTRPPDRLTIFNHFLKHLYKSQTDITLKWEKTETAWETRITIDPPGCGSFLLKFSNGTRDPINPYSRYFAVIDETSTVCMFNHRLDEQMANYDNIYHKYFIPADYEIPFNRLNGIIEANPHWIGHKVYRYYQTKFGDHIFPFVNLKQLHFLKNTVLNNQKQEHELTFDEITEIIRAIQKTWSEEFQYHCPELLGLEWLNDTIFQAAAHCGIKALSGLLPDQTIQLGQEKFNYEGIPLFPYFLNEQDFRLPGTASAPLIGLATTSHPLLIRESPAYQLCPAAAEKQRYASAQNIQPITDFINQSIRNRDLRTPHFLIIELRAHAIPEVLKMNQRTMRFLLKNARREKIVFAQKLEVAKYFLRHLTKTPERAFFLSDMYQYPPSGFDLSPMTRHKPPHAHDIMYFENSESRVCFRKPEMKPFYCYFYTKQKALSIDKPLTEADLSSIRIVILKQFEPTFRYSLKIYSWEQFDQFPIAFWEFPFQLSEVQKVLQHNFQRFIPIKDNITGSFHAIAILNLQSGLNEFYLDLGVKYRKTLTTVGAKLGKKS